MCDDDDDNRNSSFRFVEKRPKVIAQNLRHDEEVIGSLCRLSNRPVSPKSQMEQERRIRREIANSNERRRMQSINAGFQSLRALLPHHEGEKLSKAAILQQTTQYIYQVDQEKTRLLSQNCQLKRLLNQQNQDSDGGSSSDSPVPKRKKSDPGDSVDEGIGSMSPNVVPEPTLDELKREMIELRIQLEHERRLRVIYEEQSRNLETQLYPERLQPVQQQQQQHHREHQYEQQPSPSEYVEEERDVDIADVKDVKGCIDLVALAVKESRVPPIEGEHTKDDEDDDDDDKVIPESDEDDGASSSPSSSASKRRRAEIDIRCQSPRLIESQSPSPQSPPPPRVVVALQQPIQPRLYFPSTSRQNLETIVEAIRHLEGDHLFSDDALPLTTVATTVEIKMDKEACCPSSPSPPPMAPAAVSTVSAVPTDLSFRHPQHKIHQHHHHHTSVNQQQHQHIHHHQAHAVIQSATKATMQPSRPGVIVSAHS